ncbi:hypothetical protein OSTOST_15704 [Ostertagia ostertagi]
MEDVLEKLHVAFVHCAVNNLFVSFLLCYEYDVIVQGDINDPSRKFVIKPRGISPEDAENFMATVLASCDDIITLEEAANMADTSREESPSTKKRKLNERLSHEFTRRRRELSLRGEPNPTMHMDTRQATKKERTIYMSDMDSVLRKKNVGCSTIRLSLLRMETKKFDSRLGS